MSSGMIVPVSGGNESFGSSITCMGGVGLFRFSCCCFRFLFPSSTYVIISFDTNKIFSGFKSQ